MRFNEISEGPRRERTTAVDLSMLVTVNLRHVQGVQIYPGNQVEGQKATIAITDH